MERTVECYGCYWKFKEFPDMIAHLETGSCQSDLTSQGLNMIAAQCYQARTYINKEFRAKMRAGEDLREPYTDVLLPFQCQKCNRDFRTLSGLLQHSSSQSCPHTLESGAIGKLVKWLNKNYIAR
jgi:hypothetical protein